MKIKIVITGNHSGTYHVDGDILPRIGEHIMLDKRRVKVTDVVHDYPAFDLEQVMVTAQDDPMPQETFNNFMSFLRNN